MAQSLTELLRGGLGASPQAAAELFPVVYLELRRLAGSILRGESSGHTLQATALVNEAYLKLLGAEAASFQSRAHFFAVAARMMRQILVDHARKRLAGKRGGGAKKLELKEALVVSETNADEFLALHEALEALEEFDARKARVVEMRYFSGMTGEEIAEALGVSVPTVTRELRVAQAWLAARLEGKPE